MLNWSRIERYFEMEDETTVAYFKQFSFQENYGKF